MATENAPQETAPPEEAPAEDTPVEEAPVEDALSRYVREHAERALQGLEEIGRAVTGKADDEPAVETVHDLRTSLRRLRATLRSLPESFTAPLPAPEVTDGDLRFVARALSGLRDTDVLTEQLLAQLGSLPVAPAQEMAREELAAALAARRRTALAPVAECRGDPRWGRVVGRLGAWQQASPPLARPDPLHLLESARDDVRARLSAAGGDLHALHSARKAAKRWRYAAEMLLPAESAARDHYELATGVHETLGRLQDAVVARGFLEELSRSGALTAGTRDALLQLRGRARRTIEEITAEAPHLL